MIQETKKTRSLTRSETRHMKPDNPKAIDVLNEIKEDLIVKTEGAPYVAAIAEIIIREFKLRTTKP